jgi:hypothetical protein
MIRLTRQTGVILSEISEGMSLITSCDNWNSEDCTGRCVVNRTISVRSMTALGITLVTLSCLLFAAWAWEQHPDKI